MAIRVRNDGTMWCAALKPEQPGDTYINDTLHYQMSAVHGVIVSLPEPAHSRNPQWWWRSRAPADADFWCELKQEGPPMTDHPHPLAGAVKPLEWEDWSAPHRLNVTALTDFGRYGILQIYFPEMHFRVEPPCGKAFTSPTLEAAKAAAQADYENRILSAITTTPAEAIARAALERAAKQRGLWLQFDTQGEIVGWCTVEPHDPGGMSFYVNRNAIRALASDPAELAAIVKGAGE